MPTFTAVALDGTRVREDEGLGKGASFAIVQAMEKAGVLASFYVTHADGTEQGVNLLTGDVWIGNEIARVARPDAPLRIIYYKRMYADVSSASDGAHSPSGTVLDFVAVGWQATENGKNVRFGCKVWPSRKHFEVGEDI